MKKVLTVLFVLSFVISSSFAYNLEEILPENVCAELLKKGKIQNNKFKDKDTSLVLAPKTALTDKMVEMCSISTNPTLIGENLYLVEKNDFTIKKSSRVMRSISKMTSMEYYSYGDKKWEPLYKDAYCIAGPNDRTRVDDDVEGSADGKVVYCLLNDNSLGKTNYKLTYFENENELAVDFVNTTAMRYGPIRAVKTGNLHINVVVIDCNDKLLVYMMVKSKFLGLDALENRMNNSLMARLDAIYKWFLKQENL